MRVELMQGTLDMLILKALTWEAMHGYAIVSWLRQRSDEALLVEEGSLYPALHRMAKRGWIRAEWGLSENNRRAKYYTLTTAGRAQLREESSAWEQLTVAIGKVMSAEPASAGVRS
jgi:PadR family transcriptional regulator, regulatory protein PadR